MEELQSSPIDGHSYAIHNVEFSSDGSMLATCSLDGSANIWNPLVRFLQIYKIRGSIFSFLLDRRTIEDNSRDITSNKGKHIFS